MIVHEAQLHLPSGNVVYNMCILGKKESIHVYISTLGVSGLACFGWLVMGPRKASIPYLMYLICRKNRRSLYM